MSLSVRENAALSALPLLSRFGFVSRREEYASVEEQRSNLAIKSAGVDSNIGSLSGGNQQKVVLARALLSQSSLVLAEEPTAGVDVGARMEIYRILRDVSNQAPRSSSCRPTDSSSKDCATVCSSSRAGMSWASSPAPTSQKKRSAA